MSGVVSSALLHAAQGAFALSARSFRAALAAPEKAQSRLLSELAASCARTRYGREHGVRTADDFRARLPIVRYDELAPWILAQQTHERDDLLADRVLFYEKTSGSTGPAKYIPYTAALRGSFTRMFAVWAHDVLAHGPALHSGVLYFSVSPNFARERQTERGVPVGLDDDADYLGPWLKRGLARFFVSAAGADTARDADSWKRCVAEALVRRADLEVISVWNPSMLLVLLDYIEEHRTALARLVPGKRALALWARTVDYRALWPELKLVSAWESASAGPLAEVLRRRLPHVALQGKGLLATEAPLTIPLYAAGGFVPMVDEVFFELEDVGDQSLYLLHEAAAGKTYELVISQRGGLCRYRLGDRVRVTHHYGSTPCLDFVGRGGGTSDLVGEKLQEDFVADALAEVPLAFASFWSLLPVRSPRDHYVLLVDREPADRAQLEGEVDRALASAHHYAHARALGQLGPVRVQVQPRAADLVRDYQAQRGIKLGDIKHRLLFTEPADELVAQGACS